MRAILQLGGVLIAWVFLCLAASPPLSAAPEREVLTGQIVCSQCWFEADREETAYGSAGDLACALRCAGQGVGSSIAVRIDDGDESYRLYALRGSPPGGGSWAEWAGRFVEAEGTVDTRKGKERFRAKALTVLDASPWPQRPFADNHHEDTPGSTDASRNHAGHGDHAGHDDSEDGEDHVEQKEHAEQPEQALEDSGIVWTDLRGQPARLDDLREQIVLVNFWATWCLPCKKEMPDLIELHDQFSPYRVEFVAASVDAPDQAEAVLQFVRRHKINFPVVLGATTTDMEQLGLPPTLPGTVLLDEHGHIMDWFPGVIDPKEVEASIANLLGLADGGLTGTPSRVARGRPDTRGHQSHASLVPS